MGQYKKELIASIASDLVRFGYQVYISKTGEYGFYTDGNRVVCFGGCCGFYVDFSGNYSSKSRGTGWQIATEKCNITEEEAGQYIKSNPPLWATNGENVKLTTPTQYFATYGKSSGYSLFNGSLGV